MPPGGPFCSSDVEVKHVSKAIVGSSLDNFGLSQIVNDYSAGDIDAVLANHNAK